MKNKSYLFLKKMGIGGGEQALELFLPLRNPMYRTPFPRYSHKSNHTQL